MSFRRILGQNLPKQIIRKAIQNSSVAHAYLFYGRESIGKKLTAIEFAKAINCEVSGPEDGCDECGSCRRIEQGVHPDFFLLEPEKGSSAAKEGAIKIDPIRELQNKLAYLPYEAKTKVVIIDSAELMNPQAANAFLKTLEEPPGSTVLILITAHPFQLLSTIVSRCQGIKFHPLTGEMVEQILKRKLEEDPELMAAEELEIRSLRSMGRISRALDEEILETLRYREELLALVDDMSFNRMDLVFQWARNWSRHSSHVPRVLDELLNLLRDLAVLKTGSGTLYNRDLHEQLKTLARKKHLSAWLKMFDSAHRTRFALSGNANVQLSLENMLMEFCEAA